MGIKADMVGRHTEAIGSEFRYVAKSNTAG